MIKYDVQIPKQIDDVVDMIKEAQIQRSQGNSRQGLKILEEILANPFFQSTFEEQVKLELMNKKYESFAELSKWDSISTLSLQQHSGKQLYDIPFFQAETMIRAQLRCGNQWGNLLQQVQNWHEDPTSKLYLEKRFNYEQALLQITSGDFDRARFYISKESNDLLSQWKDLTKLSQVAQHFLVQKIQKIYEMKEFLTITKQLSMKNFDELATDALTQIQNWVQRQPNFSFDKLNVWDDILTARMLFLDQYKLNFKKDSSFNDQLSGRVPSQLKDLQNIGAILYTQSAKGALRMGLLDSSNTYLVKALDQRSDGHQKNNLRVVVPIVKLNIEQVKQQTINENWGFEKKFEKFSKVLTTLEAKIRQDQSNDVAIQIKATMLKQNLHKKLLSMLVNDIKTSGQDREFIKIRQTQINDQVESAFSAHERVQDLIQLSQSGTKDSVKAKSLFHFSKLCDKMLRDSEGTVEKDTEFKQKILEKAINKIDLKRDGIAKLCIRNAFSAINLSYLRARDIIPRLLDIISKHDRPEIDQEFVRASKDTPAWVFIRWISQLVAFLNIHKSEVIDEKITQIYKKYPQSMFYPFNVLESNLRINILEESAEQTQLFKKTKSYFEENYKNLYRWTEALEGLVHPEQRFHSWVRLIEDAADKCKQTNNRSRMDKLIRLMIEDVALLDKRFVGREIGDYNKKFADTYAKHLSNLELKRMSPDKILDDLSKLKEQVVMNNLSTGELSLSEFSEYLVNLDNNDFYNPEFYIEVPGQYNNHDQEPIQSKNVKIASIKKSVLILPSLMRPKRITVHGSNEKDFNLLIKGGEDLRLDQRIQQLFHIVNGIFREDSACQSRNLNLKTFGIVPITNSLGSLEWIDSTEPLKVMINREHQRVERGADLKDCAALTATKQWLTKIPGNKSNIILQHQNLLSLDSESVIDAFTRHKQMIKWSLLRNGLENLCLTSSAFITIKNQFVKSIAVFSIVSYLLGIGDRHLENFLVNTTDGEVLGIDFGCSFGAGMQLAVPELIPFRLTQQIEGVIAPHTNDGIYKQTMVHVLNALRKKKNLILDTCDIFVKEPLLDWLKKAQQKKKKQDSSFQQDGENQIENLSFYPKQKIATLKDKLHGRHPVQILVGELSESIHARRVYFDQLVLTLKGPAGSIRSGQLQQPGWQIRYSTVEEQVDCLIEMARDPNILGRAWLGWGPYI